MEAQEQRVSVIDRIKAKFDRAVSEAFQLEVWIMSGGNDYPRTEIHIREGKRIGIRNPEGKIEIMSARDVIHKYDDLGKLKERRAFGNLPEGYYRLTPDELSNYDREQMSKPSTGVIGYDG